LQTSPIIIIIIITVIESRRMRWMVHVRCTEQMKNAYKNLAGNRERKRRFVTPRHKWKDNIKMAFK